MAYYAVIVALDSDFPLFQPAHLAGELFPDGVGLPESALHLPDLLILGIMHLLPVPDLRLTVSAACFHLFQSLVSTGDLVLFLPDEFFLGGNIPVDLRQLFYHGILLVALLLDLSGQGIHILFQLHHADLQL